MAVNSLYDAGDNSPISTKSANHSAAAQVAVSFQAANHARGDNIPSN